MQSYPRLATLVASLAGLPSLSACDEPEFGSCSTTREVTEQCAPQPDGACPTGAEAVALFEGEPPSCFLADYDVAPGCEPTLTTTRVVGPTDTGSEHTECCYTAPFVTIDEDVCTFGRPLRVAGATVRSKVLASGHPQHVDLAPHDARNLAQAWSRMASLEHTAITAFARAQRLLTAWGAPPALIAATTRARHDEVRHARTAFAIASRYAGRTISPAPLPDPLDTPSLTAFAIETLHDAAMGEAIAVAQAAAALRQATDPHVRACLSQIIRDESRHASLGLRTLRWCLEVGGPALHQALRDEPLQIPPPHSGPRPAHHALWRAHGVVSQAELVAVARIAHNQVAAPAVRELLGAFA